MKGLLRRFALFGFGFAISSVFVYFFMYKNRDLPAFWPSGKVKEKIEMSARASLEDSCQYTCLGWDESRLKDAIIEGDVHFRKSKPRNKPCPEYIIEVAHPKFEQIFLNISSCDSTFSVLDVYNDTEVKSSLCPCP